MQEIKIMTYDLQMPLGEKFDFYDIICSRCTRQAVMENRVKSKIMKGNQIICKQRYTTGCKKNNREEYKNKRKHKKEKELGRQVDHDIGMYYHGNHSIFVTTNDGGMQIRTL